MEPYPLQWPAGWTRTRSRKDSKFGKKPFGQLRDQMLRELEKLGALRVVVTSDLALRNDGIPYANHSQPNDVGVAVYFRWKGNPIVIACDTYRRVWENVRAIYKTVEAMRSIERHGSTQLLDRAASGFTALPPGSEENAVEEKPERPWWEVFEMPAFSGQSYPDICGDPGHPMRRPVLKMAEAIYKTKISFAHPDRGGSDDAAVELNRALERARSALG